MRGAAALLVAGVAGSGAALAQQGGGPLLGYPTAAELVRPQILTLDQERLYAESAFGRRAGAEIEARSRELGEENRALEEVLAGEEKALTAARPTLSPEEFRARADAFDEKVQRIRAERDARLRALALFRDNEQQRFLQAVVPVLGELLREEGAVAVIDHRVLVLALDSIDVTDRAIAAVDAALGDGARDGDANALLPAPDEVPPSSLEDAPDDLPALLPDAVPDTSPGTAILAPHDGSAPALPDTPPPGLPPE